MSNNGNGANEAEADPNDPNAKARRKRKGKYCIKFKICGKRIKIDHCLCARLIIAGVGFALVIATLFIVASASKEIEERNERVRLEN